MDRCEVYPEYEYGRPNTAWISSLWIAKPYRGINYGTILLQTAMDDVYKTYNCGRVELVDGSERMGKKQNIYRNSGFSVVIENEMRANLRHLNKRKRCCSFCV